MWLACIYCLCLWALAKAYPDGPPVSACTDALPVHIKNGTLVPPQTGPSPYIIKVNASTFTPGDTLNVTIRGVSRQPFRGILIQVKPVPSSPDDNVKYSPVGLFDRIIQNTKLTTCTAMLDTLTHDDPFMKFETVFTWRSPSFMKHDIVVTATILKEFDVYWHNVQSRTIKLRKEGILPTEMLEKPWLEEIIKTVKAEGDGQLRTDLVKARFQRGFRKATDHNGYVIVNYVTNLLPYEDSPVPLTADAFSSEAVDYDPGSNVSVRTNGNSNETINTGNNDGILDNNTVNVVVDNTPGQSDEITTDEIGSSTSNETETNGLVNQTENSTNEELSPGEGHLNSNTSVVKKNEDLVKALLRGDKSAADTLQEILEKN